jgi:hypothetical protein
LPEAILKTIAYADIFDYPLKLEEVHRYVIGVEASLEQVQRILQNMSFTASHLRSVDGHFMLRGRAAIFEIRQKRAQMAAQLWPRAVRYGRVMAALPYTRMVAVTGALAVSNVDGSVDIDYFIVTQPGRVWLCRAFVVLLVRFIAATKGDVICPNYVISEDSLNFSNHSLYTAHELAQMIPLSGLKVYQDLRRCNPWIADFLPNANGFPLTGIWPSAVTGAHPLGKLAEGVLGGGVGDWLESWEMERKIRKFGTEEDESGEAAFCADWCKGHFDNHGRRTMAAYDQRVRALGLIHETQLGDRHE